MWYFEITLFVFLNSSPSLPFESPMGTSHSLRNKGINGWMMKVIEWQWILMYPILILLVMKLIERKFFRILRVPKKEQGSFYHSSISFSDSVTDIRTMDISCLVLWNSVRPLTVEPLRLRGLCAGNNRGAWSLLRWSLEGMQLLLGIYSGKKKKKVPTTRMHEMTRHLTNHCNFTV
jgi:hypothetical protein